MQDSSGSHRVPAGLREAKKPVFTGFRVSKHNSNPGSGINGTPDRNCGFAFDRFGLRSEIELLLKWRDAAPASVIGASR